MGSRFGDVKGYNEDASLNPEYLERMAKIIEACDQCNMVVLVGCLYWGNSKGKWALISPGLSWRVKRLIQL